jgi:putative GTP pyrophosphokinase
MYKSKGCVIKNQKYGYRSIHYIIESSPIKTKFTSEIQVRTIFEEGWSEIDHNIRYPYDLENPILKGYLILFNRLAGMLMKWELILNFFRRN